MISLSTARFRVLYPAAWRAWQDSVCSATTAVDFHVRQGRVSARLGESAYRWDGRQWVLDAPTISPPPSAHDGAQPFEPGYAQVAKGDLSTIPNDDWDIQVLDAEPEMYPCGRTRIDDVMHQVWWSPSLQANVAQVLRRAR
jgi:hypothetical protein